MAAAIAEMVTMELIKPSDQLLKPLHSKLLKPSFLDQLSPPCYIPLVFFYQNPHHSETLDPSGKTQHLKQSLSSALANFFPLAGRLNPGDNSVDCDDSGALFVEARFHAPFSQALQNAILPEINQFLPFHPFEMDSEKLLGTYSRNEILFAAKVTFFDCGSQGRLKHCRGPVKKINMRPSTNEGPVPLHTSHPSLDGPGGSYTVGVCLSHAVGDVMSLVSFMDSWASASRSDTPVQEPNFESGVRLFPALEPGLIPGPGPADSDADSTDPPAVSVKNVSRRLLFDKEKIAELKKLAGSQNPTRVEAVTAFIWKHLIKLERAKNEAAETMFIARHAVNVRSRISSLVSSGELAFGNFTIVTSASFVQSGMDDEKAYHDLVLLTSSGLRKVDEEFVIKNVQSDPISYINSMNASGMEQVMVRDCYFTSWNRFQVYEVDFGWGSPVLVTPAGTPAGSGVVVLMGTPSGDGIEAWVGLKEDDIPLLQDEFISLATTRVFPES